MDAYDLVVIGTGTAAQAASGRVRKAGRSVAVIDHRPFGGTCALRGCDPKKMLVSGAETIDMAHRMRGRGVDGDVRINWKELIAFKRSFTDPVPGKREQSFAERGIDAFHGTARFTGPDTIAVDGRALKAHHILIASGARPAPLDFPGANYLITSDAFMELGRLRLNDYLQSVSNPLVYAAGDAAGQGPPLTPVSSHDAKVIAANILEGTRHRPDYRGVPSVAFTLPPIAAVGLSEAAARRQGAKLR